MATKKGVSHERTQLQELGEKFGKARRMKNMSVKKLELVSGISAVTLTDLEKGRLENSSLKTINKIASCLGLKISIIVSEK